MSSVVVTFYNVNQPEKNVNNNWSSSLGGVSQGEPHVFNYIGDDSVFQNLQKSGAWTRNAFGVLDIFRSLQINHCLNKEYNTQITIAPTVDEGWIVIWNKGWLVWFGKTNIESETKLGSRLPPGTRFVF